MRFLWLFSLGVEGNTLSADSAASVQKAKTEIAQARQASVPYSFVLITGGVFSRKTGQTIPVSHLMRDALGEVGIPIYCGSDSTMTRTDVQDGVRVLTGAKVSITECEVTAISEKWHLKGIEYLLGKYPWQQVTFKPSDFQISKRAMLGRILRLVLYRINSTGTDKFSAKEKEKRSAR